MASQSNVVGAQKTKPKMDKKASRYFAESIKEDRASTEDVETFVPNIDAFLKTAKAKSKKKKSKEENILDTQEENEQDTPVDNEPITHDLSKLNFNYFKTSVKRKDLKPFQDEKYEKTGKYVKKKEKDPFPGDAPVAKQKVKKYKRGHTVGSEGIKNKYQRHEFKVREKKYSKAAKQAARTELLLQEEAGFFEVEEGDTCQISQHELANQVDIASAQKFFELKLDKFGPYKINYTRNGRFLLMGGAKGHVAAFDWQTKKLMCEMNVMETVHDVKWLHFETMYAVAQKKWTYIYDNQGVELHCLKGLNQVLSMEFLPYHFLLATANAKSYVNYLDVSVGREVAGFTTGLGRLDVMCQNPTNAIIHLGHSGGTVTLWSPNVKQPLVKVLCHGGGTRSITVDNTGRYMATSGIDRHIKIWDVRTFKCLQAYKMGAGAGKLAFSQRGLLAAGIGNIVEVYKDCCARTATSAYMSHKCPSSVASVQFCPYEDVLGVGHGEGLASLIIPGSGEPNFDALEANPYQTKKQRQQAEVKMLLEKIQPDVITLDTKSLGQVDTKTLQETMEEKKKLLFLRPKPIDFEPRYKKKGRSKGAKHVNRKKGVVFEHKRTEYKNGVKQTQQESRERQQEAKRQEPYSVFNRFRTTDD